MPKKFICRDCRDSEAVNTLTAHAFRFFFHLMMAADHYGRVRNQTRYLASTLFPLKSDIRETDIARWIAECKKTGLICFRVDAQNRSVIEVLKFGQKLRYMKSEHSIPDDQANMKLDDAITDTDIEEILSEKRPPPPTSLEKARSVTTHNHRPSCGPSPLRTPHSALHTFQLPDFTPLPTPLYASTAKSMIEGCKTAIDQIKTQARRVQKMGIITEGPRKGQPAPLPGQFTWEPREAAACILAWEGRIKQIQIATAK